MKKEDKVSKEELELEQNLKHVKQDDNKNTNYSSNHEAKKQLKCELEDITCNLQKTI